MHRHGPLTLWVESGVVGRGGAEVVVLAVQTVQAVAHPVTRAVDLVAELAAGPLVGEATGLV